MTVRTIDDCNCYSASLKTYLLGTCFDYYDGKEFSYGDKKVFDISKKDEKCGTSFYCPSKYETNQDYNCIKINENSNNQHLYINNEVIKLPCIYKYSIINTI